MKIAPAKYHYTPQTRHCGVQVEVGSQTGRRVTKETFPRRNVRGDGAESSKPWQEAQRYDCSQMSRQEFGI